MAVIDIGSNTIRLLVADVTGDVLKSVLDKSEFVALGRGVDANQRLADDRGAAALQAIGDLAERQTVREPPISLPSPRRQFVTPETVLNFYASL